MNWLWHVWVLAVTFMTDLSLCLVTVVITMQQYYTENRKKNIFLIQQTPLSFRKYFFSSFCIWATHLLIQSECSMHMCDREIDIYTHIYTLSIIFWKCTSTVQLCTSLCWSELWISTESFFDLIFWALYPNTKSIESITLDFPLPFGPMMQEKR